VYKAYSPVGNKRITRIPLIRLKNWINTCAEPLMVMSLPHSINLARSGLADNRLTSVFINRCHQLRVGEK
jgi:hypothetical protein